MFRNLWSGKGRWRLLSFFWPRGSQGFCQLRPGLYTLSLKFFVVAVAIFRLPSTFLLTLQGAEAAKGHYWLSVGRCLLRLLPF